MLIYAAKEHFISAPRLLYCPVPLTDGVGVTHVVATIRRLCSALHLNVPKPRQSTSHLLCRDQHVLNVASNNHTETGSGISSVDIDGASYTKLLKI